MRKNYKKRRINKRHYDKRPTMIFDDVFKTICERMPKLLIPLINEAFGKSYDDDEELIQIRNERHFAHRKIITDALVKIQNQIYHIECQSFSDKTMVLRMFEYDASVALENWRLTSEGYEIDFPHSCVVYLRNNPDDELLSTLNIRFQDGQTKRFELKTINVQSYSKDEIFQKNLLMFLPFYILRYEKSLPNDDDSEGLKKLLDEYRSIVNELELALPLEKSDYYTRLVDLINRISDYVACSNENVRKGIGDIMGGRVLVTRTDRIIARSEAKGKAEGRAEGKAEGKMDSLVSLVNDGDITLERAAEKLQMTIPAFKEKVKEYGLTLTIA